LGFHWQRIGAVDVAASSGYAGAGAGWGDDRADALDVLTEMRAFADDERTG
jgi:hypothetical protein